MPTATLKLEQAPTASGSVDDIEAALPLDTATCGLVLTYLTAKVGFITEDGEIVGQERSAEDGVTPRPAADVVAGLLAGLINSYVRDAKLWATTTNVPDVTEVDASAAVTSQSASA